MHLQARLQQLELQAQQDLKLQQGLNLQQDLKLHPLKLQQALKLQHPGLDLLEVHQQLTMMSLEVAQLQLEGEAMAEEVWEELGEGEAQKLGLWPSLQLVGITKAYGGCSCLLDATVSVY